MSLLVGSRRASAYTACAGASISLYIRVQVLGSARTYAMIPPSFDPELSGEPQNRRIHYERLPTIRATPIAVRGPICMQKSK